MPDIIEVLVEETVVEIETQEVVVVEILKQRGADGPPGPSGLASLVADPDPHLGGDLIMNGFQFKGLAEDTEFVLDGGLL